MIERLKQIGIHTNKTTGNIKTKCPKCSHNRRNKTDLCLSVNLDEGLYNCHHCGWNGNVKFKPKVEYTLPPKANVNTSPIE